MAVVQVLLHAGPPPRQHCGAVGHPVGEVVLDPLLLIALRIDLMVILDNLVVPDLVFRPSHQALHADHFLVDLQLQLLLQQLLYLQYGPGPVIGLLDIVLLRDHVRPGDTRRSVIVNGGCRPHLGLNQLRAGCLADQRVDVRVRNVILQADVGVDSPVDNDRVRVTRVFVESSV